jgi:hypothetical protein
MIISKNHLQSICNYTEVSSIKNPQFSYLEMEESNSDDYKEINTYLDSSVMDK